MNINLTIKEADLVLAALEGPSVTDPKLARIYDRIKAMRDGAKFARNRNHADAQQ